MFKSDLVKPLALALGLLTCVIIWASYHVGSEIGETRGERNYHTTSYERHASDEIRGTCLSGQGGDIAECVSQVIKATNEDKRSEDDRVAQTEMARWAFYMFIATVIMAVISGAGVILIWKTLAATIDTIRLSEKTTKALVNVSRAENIPNVEIIGVTPFPEEFGMKIHQGTKVIRFNVELQNIGKNVAKYVRCIATVGAQFNSFSGGKAINLNFDTLKSMKTSVFPNQPRINQFAIKDVGCKISEVDWPEQDGAWFMHFTFEITYYDFLANTEDQGDYRVTEHFFCTDGIEIKKSMPPHHQA